MSLADFDKWISGETEIFFNPGKTPHSPRSFFWKLIALVVLAICILILVGLVTSTQRSVEPFLSERSTEETAGTKVASAPLPAMPTEGPQERLNPVPPDSKTSPLTGQANALMNFYWQSVEDSGDRVLPYLSSIYAPMVSYYGRTLPKEAVLRDKYYFLRRWPIRQTWEAEGPSISCNEADAVCRIVGIRKYKAMSAERGVRASGMVRYSYAAHFIEGSPQIIVESSQVVH